MKAEWSIDFSQLKISLMELYINMYLRGGCGTVTNYLIEEKGYTAEEIQSVKGVWGIKLPAFYAVVVFKDEPFVEYIYFAHNAVHQFEYRLSDEGKQKGINEADLKHFVPY
ncbi:DUF3139 domain-containing protein [Paenibacillus solisilvae]|uniref:DUF3139 domain-containing protein n=1 Tax=Paenibacillus solisilvae TaxID=2486751 RepID=A0ABW0W242_9BACL